MLYENYAVLDIPRHMLIDAPGKISPALVTRIRTNMATLQIQLFRL